jgi:hypothetical protein
MLGLLLLGTHRLGRMNTSRLRDACLPRKYVGMQTAHKYFREKDFPSWDIYSHRPLSPNDKDSGFSAEHVYPRSLLVPNEDAKKDIHNLFFTRLFINRHRNNYRFSETITASNSIKMVGDDSSDGRLHFDESLYNYKDSQQKTFVPIRSARGPIARSIAYMGLIYPELDIQDIIDLKLLKEWNNVHPPDNREITRNKKIRSIQYNENPFILVPKLVDTHF